MTVEGGSAAVEAARKEMLGRAHRLVTDVVMGRGEDWTAVGRALDAFAAVCRAEGVIQFLSNAGWPHDYLPGGLHSSDCRACFQLKIAKATRAEKENA